MLHRNLGLPREFLARQAEILAEEYSCDIWLAVKVIARTWED
jgi:hypothetical protein